MRYLRLVFMIVLSVFLIGCDKEEDYGTGIRPDGPSYVPKDCVFQVVGLKNPSADSDSEDRFQSFTYTGYAPLKDKPVKVCYYIPETAEVKEMPVLFTFTGAERTGNTQLNAWKNFADAYGFAVINPQFADKKIWKENDYQFGGVTDSEGNVVDRSLWTFNIVESLFDYWLHEVDGTQTGYRMFGHSAGGQFVGRMMMAMPEARVIRAVAANPSSWAWPVALTDGTNTYGWPYSVSDLPQAQEDDYLTKVFSNNLIVQVGENDTDTESLDQSAAANLQGERRYPRAKNFYQACVDKAEADGLDCAFRLAEVEGVGHSTWHMVYGYYKPTAANIKEEQLGEYSAYLLLFK